MFCHVREAHPEGRLLESGWHPTARACLRHVECRQVGKQWLSQRHLPASSSVVTVGHARHGAGPEERPVLCRMQGSAAQCTGPLQSSIVTPPRSAHPRGGTAANQHKLVQWRGYNLACNMHIATCICNHRAGYCHHAHSISYDCGAISPSPPDLRPPPLGPFLCRAGGPASPCFCSIPS